MKGAMEYFLLFLVGVLALLLIGSTIVGRGIAYNFWGILAQMEPSHLQEVFRTYLTVASYSPGEFEGRIKVAFEHVITLNNTPSPTVLVETPQQFKFSKGDVTPTPFLTDCGMFKICVKACGFIGDRCDSQDDCCGVLSCDIGFCKSTTTCRNGALDLGEICDPGQPPITPPQDAACPGRCIDCVCSDLPQCNDNLDNDYDNFIDEDDSGCHWDGDATNIASYDPNDDDETNGAICGNDVKEGSEMCDRIDDAACPGECQSNCRCPDTFNLGESCANDNDCWGLLICSDIVDFEKIGGTAVVKKYFEGNICRLKIEGRR